jgi:hypothetical protein
LRTPQNTAPRRGDEEREGRRIPEPVEGLGATIQDLFRNGEARLETEWGNTLAGVQGESEKVRWWTDGTRMP